MLPDPPAPGSNMTKEEFIARSGAMQGLHRRG